MAENIDIQAQPQSELTLRLNAAQQQALGLTSPPKAGALWSAKVEAAVVRSESSTDALTVQLHLTAISLEDGSPPVPVSPHLGSRASALLYKCKQAKAWSALKVDERNVGGSPAIGEHGGLNRKVGA